MKRIFLTSGLVLCMACPAFADLTAPIENHSNGVVSGTENSQNPIDPTCQYPTLEGYNGTSTFTAKWTPVFKTITIDSNIGTTSTTGGVTTLTPQTLYSVPGNSLVWTGKDANDNLTGGTNDAGIGAAGLVLTNNPMVTQGIFVNYTLDSNSPNSETPDMTQTSTTGNNRPFLGVFDAVDGSTIYIDTDGNLTNAGASAASANTNGTTWYANYGPVSPTVNGTPELDGYNFLGWNTDQNATTALGTLPAIKDNNTTLFAIWEAVGYTITYNCGQPAGASTTASSPDPASQSVTMDGPYTLAGADTCTLDGYTFAGWSCPNLPGIPTLPAGTPTYFAGGAQGTYSYPGNITCTAQWTPNTINLVWDDNDATSGGTGGGDACTFDGSITMPTTPSRTGYEFGGWEVVNTAN